MNVEIRYQKPNWFQRTWETLVAGFYVFFISQFVIAKRIDDQEFYLMLDGRIDFCWAGFKIPNGQRIIVGGFIPTYLILRRLRKRHPEAAFNLVSFGDYCFMRQIFYGDQE